MITLTNADFELIRKQLEKELAQVEERLEVLSREDPFLQEDRTYNHELAQDATDIAGHDRVIALSSELTKHKGTISKALAKLDDGTYGKCESCQTEISADRLRIMPMAVLCVSCEEKLERQ